MTGSELTRVFAEKAGITLKDARGYMDALGEVIFDKLAEGEDVALFELGKLKVVESPAREVLKNPKQPELGKKI